MWDNDILDAIEKDKNLYHLTQYPMITVYDDNFFVRNDYDILSHGQRNYLIKFFNRFGFKQKSGKLMTNGNVNIHFPKPKHTLALSGYQAAFNEAPNTDFYAVTPSTFAEAIFYEIQSRGEPWVTEQLQSLIQTCPYNIELTRDINYRTPIEQITKQLYQPLLDFQQTVIDTKFKFKKAL